jgi:hypothetical protein
VGALATGAGLLSSRRWSARAVRGVTSVVRLAPTDVNKWLRDWSDAEKELSRGGAVTRL